MFFDLYTSLRTPCSPYVRNMGYLSEAVDMSRRAARNLRAWQPHLDATRRFVLAVAEQCPDKDKAVILGSGPLLDLPLAELSSLFREVALKDVVCLPRARKELKRHANVSFAEHDVTGVAEQLYRHARQGISELPAPLRVRPSDERRAGLVVSLNILSQLWVVPRTFASQRMRQLAPDRVDEWRGRITEAHYASLRSLSCPVCLIADHGFVKRDGSGAVISSGSTIGDLVLPEPDESWTWHIAPLSSSSPDLSKELIVGAWRFN